MNISPTELEAIKRMYDNGLGYAAIGARMGWTKNKVAGQLNRHYKERRRRIPAERIMAWKAARTRRLALGG